MSDDVRRFVVGAQERVEGFLESLREQGLHVGVGPKGEARCVTCDEQWPCAGAVADTLP